MKDSGNEALIRRFYEAFRALDADTMQACYCADAAFDDPAFSLRGRDEIGAMWRMLCARAQDFSLEYEILEANAQGGKVRWTARYLFSQTGRKVVNHIEAQIKIKDGLIVEHIDRFSFWRWARQALGPAGLLLGWSRMLQMKVRAQALKNLKAWVDKNGL